MKRKGEGKSGREKGVRGFLHVLYIERMREDEEEEEVSGGEREMGDDRTRIRVEEAGPHLRNMWDKKPSTNPFFGKRRNYQ